MSRSKEKGTKFETAVVRYLREMTGDQSIGRMALHGTNDEGDISGLTFNGREIVVECKNTRQLNLTEHMRETRREQFNRMKQNPNLLVKCGVLIQHAPGVGLAHMGDQWAVLRLEDLVSILNEANSLAKEASHDR